MPPRGRQHNGLKITMILLSAIVGAVFLFSAYSKTEPVAYFEYTISSQLHLSMKLSAVLARFFIGLEAALGLLLLLSILGWRRWVLRCCLYLLLLFSLHLFYLLLTQGNDVNCGCMGNIAPMSPMLSLLKNAGLIAMISALLKWHRPQDGAVLNVASFPVAAIIIAVPFFVYPMQKQLQLPLSRLYTTTRSEHPVTELRRGKHILCLMSLSCRHCRKAAAAIAVMKKDNPSLPFYFALSGGTDSTRKERFADFLAETHAQDIPYHFLSPEDFIDMVRAAGSDGVPVILWMQDTTVVRKIDAPALNQKEIEHWIAQ